LPEVNQTIRPENFLSAKVSSILIITDTVTRIFERMRGIYTPVTDLRRRLLMETVQFIIEGKDPSEFESLPFKIIEMGKPAYRCCFYQELSIVKQRLRLAFGLPLIEERENMPVSRGIERAFTSEKIIAVPLVNVIRAACETCPEDEVIVTDKCQSCMAHPCSIVCPRNAITRMVRPWDRSCTQL